MDTNSTSFNIDEFKEFYEKNKNISTLIEYLDKINKNRKLKSLDFDNGNVVLESGRNLILPDKIKKQLENYSDDFEDLDNFPMYVENYILDYNKKNIKQTSMIVVSDFIESNLGYDVLYQPKDFFTVNDGVDLLQRINLSETTPFAMFNDFCRFYEDPLEKWNVKNSRLDILDSVQFKYKGENDTAEETFDHDTIMIAYHPESETILKKKIRYIKWVLADNLISVSEGPMLDTSILEEIFGIKIIKHEVTNINIEGEFNISPNQPIKISLFYDLVMFEPDLYILESDESTVGKRPDKIKFKIKNKSGDNGVTINPGFKGLLFKISNIVNYSEIQDLYNRLKFLIIKYYTNENLLNIEYSGLKLLTLEYVDKKTKLSKLDLLKKSFGENYSIHFSNNYSTNCKVTRQPIVMETPDEKTVVIDGVNLKCDDPVYSVLENPGYGPCCFSVTGKSQTREYKYKKTDLDSRFGNTMQVFSNNILTCMEKLGKKINFEKEINTGMVKQELYNYSDFNSDFISKIFLDETKKFDTKKFIRLLEEYTESNIFVFNENLELEMPETRYQYIKNKKFKDTIIILVIQHKTETYFQAMYGNDNLFIDFDKKNFYINTDGKLVKSNLRLLDYKKSQPIAQTVDKDGKLYSLLTQENFTFYTLPSTPLNLPYYIIGDIPEKNKIIEILKEPIRDNGTLFYKNGKVVTEKDSGYTTYRNTKYKCKMILFLILWILRRTPEKNKFQNYLETRPIFYGDISVPRKLPNLQRPEDCIEYLSKYTNLCQNGKIILYNETFAERIVKYIDNFLIRKFPREKEPEEYIPLEIYYKNSLTTILDYTNYRKYPNIQIEKDIRLRDNPFLYYYKDKLYIFQRSSSLKTACHTVNYWNKHKINLGHGNTSTEDISYIIYPDGIGSGVSIYKFESQYYAMLLIQS